MTNTIVTFADWMVADPRVPLHLRLTLLAYRDADPTDVLYLDPGDLARLVGVRDRRILHKAVQRAVEVGFLDRRSGTTALRLAPVGSRND
ncbi:hypothetical protein [Oryzobacter terrae]|uniref:hypothetical protein n=1 Tax=Oryzobacter terrae TaxID=1620385 RepID=UPI003671A1FD